MSKLKVIVKTPLKSRTIPFIELNSKYCYWLNVDTKLAVEIVKEKDNHLEVKLLTANLKNLPVGVRVWYIYKEHVEVIEESRNLVTSSNSSTTLKTDYYYQIDNQYQPYTSCFLTCVAMLLSFYKAKVTPDELYTRCLNLGYDRFSHQDISEILRSYGVNYTPKTNGTFKEMKEVLKKAPVILGTYLTEGTHIVLLVGFDDSAYDGRGAFIVNDPYGEFTHSGYIHTPLAGKETLYSYSLIKQVGAPEGDGNYWIHVPN
jgi:hypothetical protein